MGLDGNISSNGTALPSGLQVLAFGNNLIKGSIPYPLPSGLLTLSIYGNRMTGDVPPIPSSVNIFYLGTSAFPGNHFTGKVELNAPNILQINSNWITDVVVHNVGSLSTCDLSNNPLLNNSDIANLTMCTKNALYSANLLPLTLQIGATASSTGIQSAAPTNLDNSPASSSESKSFNSSTLSN